ncbi:hypothetical protein L1987_54014 [Smallanthus sonchifolius]|uniref:Uncharacterized protein n=1 Tax=Smallanthus sonchifolius TaxID=185202 RepID=A0ACB9E6F0_9ASTR|nr:hypothetical protein L1987_54014 [Smallanthus sonchifolius]
MPGMMLSAADGGYETDVVGYTSGMGNWGLISYAWNDVDWLPCNLLAVTLRTRRLKFAPFRQGLDSKSGFELQYWNQNQDSRLYEKAQINRLSFDVTLFP